MKTIGIKLADGTFYPVLQEGSSNEVILDLTTANNNQTKVMVDLYRSKTNSMDDAEYVDSLQIDNLNAHPNGEPDIKFTVSIDDDNNLSARIVDSETGAQSDSTITLVSRTIEERLITDEYDISKTENNDEDTEDPDAKEAAAVAAMATGVGLLAAAEAIRNEIEEPVVEENPSVASQFIEDDLSAFGGEASQEEQKESLENFFDTVTEETPLPDFDDSAFEITEDTELPDFDEPATEEPAATAPEEPSTATSEDTIIEETTGLPDFDDEDFSIPDLTTDLSIDMPDTFDTPADFNTSDDFEKSLDMDTQDDFTPSSGGISFTGLYDTETELGDSSETEGKKTKTPVIICIICAIICIIAVALLLFVLPTKFNILNKKAAKEQTVVEQPVEEAPEPVAVTEPEPIPEPEPVPEAKEDEIVIIEKAEEVIPLPPPVAEEKPKDIIYKIKWGDTLWDLADTYYKNPWRYKYIARFNGIKDPDYIVSGTYITIPAE